MKRYARKDKYMLEDSRPKGVPKNARWATKNDKQEIANANRSLKKSVRQKAKKDLRDFIDR